MNSYVSCCDLKNITLSSTTYLQYSNMLSIESKVSIPIICHWITGRRPYR